MPSAGLISLRETVWVEGGEREEEGSKSANEQPLHNRVEPRRRKGEKKGSEGCGDEWLKMRNWKKKDQRCRIKRSRVGWFNRKDRWSQEVWAVNMSINPSLSSLTLLGVRGGQQGSWRRKEEATERWAECGRRGGEGVSYSTPQSTGVRKRLD